MLFHPLLWLVMPLAAIAEDGLLAELAYEFEHDVSTFDNIPNADLFPLDKLEPLNDKHARGDEAWLSPEFAEDGQRYLLRKRGFFPLYKVNRTEIEKAAEDLIALSHSPQDSIAKMLSKVSREHYTTLIYFAGHASIAAGVGQSQISEILEVYRDESLYLITKMVPYLPHDFKDSYQIFLNNVVRGDWNQHLMEDQLYTLGRRLIGEFWQNRSIEMTVIVREFVDYSSVDSQKSSRILELGWRFPQMSSYLPTWLNFLSRSVSDMFAILSGGKLNKEITSSEAKRLLAAAHNSPDRTRVRQAWPAVGEMTSLFSELSPLLSSIQIHNYTKKHGLFSPAVITNWTRDGRVPLSHYATAAVAMRNLTWKAYKNPLCVILSPEDLLQYTNENSSAEAVAQCTSLPMSRGQLSAIWNKFSEIMDGHSLLEESDFVLLPAALESEFNFNMLEEFSRSVRFGLNTGWPRKSFYEAIARLSPNQKAVMLPTILDSNTLCEAKDVFPSLFDSITRDQFQIILPKLRECIVDDPNIRLPKDLLTLWLQIEFDDNNSKGVWRKSLLLDLDSEKKFPKNHLAGLNCELIEKIKLIDVLEVFSVFRKHLDGSMMTSGVRKCWASSIRRFMYLKSLIYNITVQKDVELLSVMSLQDIRLIGADVLLTWGPDVLLGIKNPFVMADVLKTLGRSDPAYFLHHHIAPEKLTILADELERQLLLDSQGKVNLNMLNQLRDLLPYLTNYSQIESASSDTLQDFFRSMPKSGRSINGTVTVGPVFSKAVCTSKRNMDALRELVLKAFGPTNTWSASDMYQLGDFLIVLKEEDFSEVKTKELMDVVTDLVYTSMYHVEVESRTHVKKIPYFKACANWLEQASKDEMNHFMDSFKTYNRFLLLGSQYLFSYAANPKTPLKRKKRQAPHIQLDGVFDQINGKLTKETILRLSKEEVTAATSLLSNNIEVLAHYTRLVLHLNDSVSNRAVLDILKERQADNSTWKLNPIEDRILSEISRNVQMLVVQEFIKLLKLSHADIGLTEDAMAVVMRAVPSKQLPANLTVKLRPNELESYTLSPKEIEEIKLYRATSSPDPTQSIKSTTPAVAVEKSAEIEEENEDSSANSTLVETFDILNASVSLASTLNETYEGSGLDSSTLTSTIADLDFTSPEYPGMATVGTALLPNQSKSTDSSTSSTKAYSTSTEPVKSSGPSRGGRFFDTTNSTQSQSHGTESYSAIEVSSRESTTQATHVPNDDPKIISGLDLATSSKMTMTTSTTVKTNVFSSSLSTHVSLPSTVAEILPSTPSKTITSNDLSFTHKVEVASTSPANIPSTSPAKIASTSPAKIASTSPAKIASTSPANIASSELTALSTTKALTNSVQSTSEHASTVPESLPYIESAINIDSAASGEHSFFLADAWTENLVTGGIDVLGKHPKVGPLDQLKLTCGGLREGLMTASVIGPQDLDDMYISDLKDCLEAFGALPLNRSTVIALIHKLELSWETLPQYSPTMIGKIGWYLPVSDDPTSHHHSLDYLSMHVGWSQIENSTLTQEFLTRYLTHRNGGMSQPLATEEVAGLGSLVCHLNGTSWRRLIRDQTFRQTAEPYLSNLQCKMTQFKEELGDKVLRAFGSPHEWSGVMVERLGWLVAALPKEHLQHISPVAAAQLKPEAAAALVTLDDLTLSQIYSLSPLTASIFSPHQLANVPEEKLIALQAAGGEMAQYSGSTAGCGFQSSILVLAFIFICIF